MRKRKLKVTIGLFLVGIGTITILPPPDIEIIIITVLAILGIPLKYSIPSMYIFSFLIILYGSWLIGKNVFEVLKLKKSKKNEKKK